MILSVDDNVIIVYYSDEIPGSSVGRASDC